MTDTPARSVRIPEKLWKQAKVKAKKEHTTISAIIVKALYEWVNE